MKTFLIIFVVLMYIMTGILFSVLSHGEYFWYRVLAIWPFTIAMVKTIGIIRKYKKPVEIEL